MVNLTGVNLCPPPFFDVTLFSGNCGCVDGRVCQSVTGDLKFCLPCPMGDWVYPDSFKMVTVTANWVAAISGVCCVALLASWVALPVDKMNRHYLSVCFTFGVLLMNLGFIIPLAARPDQCFDKITPHDMRSSKVCGASGTFLLLGGWCGVMWAFLRSFSLHLQICWQVLVGRNFMIFAQVAGWGIPLVGIVLALVFSGVSFRFGATCHINHPNSLADLWIPLLIFAGATVIITFATFGYCVKVYLASLSDHSASTEGSGLPAYSNSTRTMSPRQAYGRVRRVVALQWRGIAIVLIIIADVIFFSVIFVFQDNIVQSVTQDPEVAKYWVMCLIGTTGDKTRCLDKAKSLVVNEATGSVVLLLLFLNGVWLFLLLGRCSMIRGWIELAQSLVQHRKKEFVSVDAHYEAKKGSRAYEMLSKESSALASPVLAVKSPPKQRGATDYFGQEAYHYHAPVQSFSSPRPPQTSIMSRQKALVELRSEGYDANVNSLGMNQL